jgi:hypothetical protein
MGMDFNSGEDVFVIDADADEIESFLGGQSGQ